MSLVNRIIYQLVAEKLIHRLIHNVLMLKEWKFFCPFYIFDNLHKISITTEAAMQNRFPTSSSGLVCPSSVSTALVHKHFLRCESVSVDVPS